MRQWAGERRSAVHHGSLPLPQHQAHRGGLLQLVGAGGTGVGVHGYLSPELGGS